MTRNDCLPTYSAPLAALPELLDAWNRHQDLRRAGAPVRDLASSRARLDAVRGRR